MKKLLTVCAGLLVAIAFTSVDLMATMEIQKKHTKPGKDGAKINCAYCHTAAKVAKKKGVDKKEITSNANCSDCHK